MNQLVLYTSGSTQLIYYPHFFDTSYFMELQQGLPWQQNEIRVFGKTHLEPRLTCWFGPAYTYSSIQWPQAELPPLLKEIQTKLSSITVFPFNAVLANFYRNGEDSMGWHSDNEPEMDTSLIASATFGGKRLLKFRNKLTNEKLDVELLDRSLLLMYNMQTQWQHGVLKTKRDVQPRINLTFRKIKIR